MKSFINLQANLLVQMITEALGANEKGPDLQLACDHTRRESSKGDTLVPKDPSWFQNVLDATITQ